MNKPVGIYIHIPFCLKKCNYCDFCSYSDMSSLDDYFPALFKHILSSPRPTADSVYIGGGTPTCVPQRYIGKLLDTVSQAFSLTSDAEISIECNPKTADKEYFSFLRSHGVNRLSIGMQSSCDTELKLLGRIHSYADTVNAVCDARDSGIKNINLDLMYGIPEQTLQSFEKTISDAMSLGVEHISAYALKIEENTVFYKNRNNLSLPDEDEVCDEAEMCRTMLSSGGFKRYEISNFAKDGYACRHNMKYWTRKDYLAYGVSSSGFFGGKRYTFCNNILKYIDFCNKKTPLDDVLTECEVIDDKEAEREYIMLALRLTAGISADDFQKSFGHTFEEKYGKLFSVYENHSLAKRENGRYFLTNRGLFVSNAIISELIYSDKD